MKVTKLPSGNYRIQKMVNGTRHSKTFDHKPTKKEIDQWVNALDPDPIKQTFASAAEIYIQSKSNILSPSTIRGYRKDIRMIPTLFQDTNISDINQLMIQKLVNDLSETHAPKTVANVHGLISAVLRQSRPNMIINTTLPKKCRNAEYIPSDSDIKRITEYLQGDIIHIPVLLGCYGLRKSEMMALTLSDLSDDNWLTINKAMVRDSSNNWITKPMTKTEASCRIIPLPPEIADLIRKQGFIYNGSENALNRHLHVAQDNLNIPRFSYHKLRHYFASRISTLTDEQTAIDLGGWETDYIMKKVYRHSLELADQKKQIAHELLTFITNQ